MSRSHDFPEMCSARADDGKDVSGGCVLRDLLQQLVREDVLSDADRDGAPESVEEDCHCISDRHVFLVQDDLYGDEGDLDAGACSNPGEDFVSNPDTGARMHFQSVDHARANGENDDTDPHGRIVRSHGCDAASDHDRCQGDADQIWDTTDTGRLGRDAFDGLEIEWEVVNVTVKPHGQEGREQRASSYGTVADQDPRRHGGPVLQPDLDTDERRHDQTEA